MNKNYLILSFFALSIHASQQELKSNIQENIPPAARSVRAVVANQAQAHNANQPHVQQQHRCIMDIFAQMTPEQFNRIWERFSTSTQPEAKESNK